MAGIGIRGQHRACVNFWFCDAAKITCSGVSNATKASNLWPIKVRRGGQSGGNGIAIPLRNLQSHRKTFQSHRKAITPVPTFLPPPVLFGGMAHCCRKNKTMKRESKAYHHLYPTVVALQVSAQFPVTNLSLMDSSSRRAIPAGIVNAQHRDMEQCA